MGEYTVVYNQACYCWVVLSKGREVYGTTTKADAERWASTH